MKKMYSNKLDNLDKMEKILVNTHTTKTESIRNRKTRIGYNKVKIELVINNLPHVVKMAIPYKLIYRLNTIPIKLPAAFYPKTDKVVLKFILKCKKPRIPRKKKSWKRIKLKDLHFIILKLATQLQ